MFPTQTAAGTNSLICGVATVTGWSSSSGSVSSESIVTTLTNGFSSTSVTARTVTSYSSAVFGGALSVTVGAVHVSVVVPSPLTTASWNVNSSLSVALPATYSRPKGTTSVMIPFVT